MSAYRSGTASAQSAVVGPAKALIAALALPPDWARDRFIVLQTGSRIVAGDDRGAWIGGLYGALAADPAFLGVVYFDAADWAMQSAASPPQPLAGFPAWTAAMTALPPASARLDGTFEPFFWDVGPWQPQYAEIQSLRAAGMTSGCDTAPPRFCPDQPLSRAAAAILMARAFGVTPLPASTPLFGDVGPGTPGFGEIQALANAGVVSGCAASAYCPDEPMSRATLAVALAALSKPAAAAGGAFSDLAAGDPATTAIEALAALQRVDGCGAGAFCPTDPTLRGVGSAWIVRSAGLAPAPPL